MILNSKILNFAPTVEKKLIEIKRINQKDSERICKVWHYTKTVPTGRNLFYGVWEKSNFVGVVIFGYGAGFRMGHSEGFEQKEVCELVRVALSGKQETTSKILAKCLKVFKVENPNIKAIYSYSDMNQDHYGTIYQATNWIYLGTVKSNPLYIDLQGNKVHGRHVKNKKDQIKRGLKKVKLKHKHKYIFPLTKKHKRILSKLHRPYPKKPCEGLTEQSSDQLDK